MRMWHELMTIEVLYGKTFSFQVFPFVTLYFSFAFLFTLSYFSWQLWCQLGWQVKVSNSISLCSDEASYTCNILRWWCDLEQISVHSQMQINGMALFISLLKSFILKALWFFFHTFLCQTPFWSFALCLSISPQVLTSFISWYRAGFVVVVEWGFLTEHFVLGTIHDKDIFCCSCLAMHVYLSKQLIYHFKM